MANETFCPLHGVIDKTLEEIKGKQDSRKCATNESDIYHIKDILHEVKSDNLNQWTAINRLRWYVAMGAGGAGVLAFVGSIVGAWLKR